MTTNVIKNKFLFLDTDGVLNGYKTWINKNQERTSKIMDIMKENVTILNKILNKYPEISIVFIGAGSLKYFENVSNDIVTCKLTKEFMEKLLSCGMSRKNVSRIEYSFVFSHKYRNMKTRAIAIHKWLNDYVRLNHPNNYFLKVCYLINFVILDDESIDYYYDKPKSLKEMVAERNMVLHHIKPVLDVGLQYSDISKIDIVLNNYCEIFTNMFGIKQELFGNKNKFTLKTKTNFYRGSINYGIYGSTNKKEDARKVEEMLFNYIKNKS